MLFILRVPLARYQAHEDVWLYFPQTETEGTICPVNETYYTTAEERYRLTI